MDKLNLFNNKDLNIAVRAILIEHTPYLIAIDVAKSLGYKKPRDAIKSHCRRGVKYAVSDNHGVRHITWIIPESDVYRLIMRSNMPKAIDIQDWLAEEVIPALRKHGMYITDKVLNNPELLKRTVDKYYAEHVARLKVETKLELANEDIRRMGPKEKYHDKVLQSIGTFTTRVIAKELKMTAQALHKILHAKKIIYPSGDGWVMFAMYQNMGYMETKTHLYKSKSEKGKQKTKIHSRWTQKGRRFVHMVIDEELRKKTNTTGESLLF